MQNMQGKWNGWWGGWHGLLGIVIAILAAFGTAALLKYLMAGIARSAPDRV